MIFAAIADAGCVPLARVPKGNHDYIKRVLDAGAWGIVVPMVDTVEQAQIAIRAAKYPPVGQPQPGRRHARHQLRHHRRRLLQARPTTRSWSCCRPKARRAWPTPRRSTALPGVDAIFVGPVDLRANMRSPDGREATDAEFEAMLPARRRGRQENRHADRHAHDGSPGGSGTGRAGHAIHRHRQRAADDDPKGTGSLRAVRPEVGRQGFARY